MKKVIVLFLVLFFSLPFAVATSTEGSSCVVDEDCSGALLCNDRVCSTPSSTTLDYAPTVSTSSTCSTTADCSPGFACDLTASCTTDADGNGIADVDESIPTCVSDEDCTLNQICDYSTYTCVSVDSVSSGSCLSSSQCGSGYTCYHRNCVPESREGGVQSGITPDNPYLGGITSLFNTLRRQTTNDPEVLQHLTQQALRDSNALDKRKALGIVSEQAYAQGKTQLAQEAVQGLQKTYTSLSQESPQQVNGNFQLYNTRLRQLNSLAQRADSQLASLQVPQAGYAQNIMGLRSQIHTAQQQYYSHAQNLQGSAVVTCTTIPQEGVISGTFYVTGSDGSSVSLTDVGGNSYQFVPFTNGFSVLGTSVSVYLLGGTYTGSEIDFTLSQNQQNSGQTALTGTGKAVGDLFTGFVTASVVQQNQFSQQQNQIRSQITQQGFSSLGTKVFGGLQDTGASSAALYYDVYVDGQYIGSVDLAGYGKSILGLGGTILYTYEAQTDGSAFLLVDNSLFLSLSSSSTKACLLGQTEQQGQAQASVSSTQQGQFSQQQNQIRSQLTQQKVVNSQGSTFTLQNKLQKERSLQMQQKIQQQQKIKQQAPLTGQAVSRTTFRKPVFWKFLFYRN